MKFFIPSLQPVAYGRQFSMLRERFTSLFINLSAWAILFIFRGRLHYRAILPAKTQVGNIQEYYFGECKLCASND